MRKCLFALVAVLGVGIASSVGYSLVQNNNQAVEQPKNTVSKIVKVVVYPHTALVTREVDVPAGAGVAELVVAALPAQVVSSSLYSEGTNGIRVLSTRFRTQQVEVDAREEVRKLEEEKAKVETTIEKLDGDIRAVEENMKMLSKLENFTSVTSVSTTEKGGLNGETVINMAKYVMEQRALKAKELVALKQQVKTAKQQVDFFNRKLSELSAGSSKVERDAVILVDRDKGAGGKVRLNYMVDHVTWAPQYKLRAGQPKDDVQIDYLASLVQQSGEEWKEVDVILSTAQPMLNAAPPELRKVEITVVPKASVIPPPGSPKSGPGGSPPPASQPEPIMHQAQPPGALKGQAGDYRDQAKKLGQILGKEKDIDWALNEAAALEQTIDLIKSSEEVAAALRKGKPGNEGPSVTYHLKHKLSLPSRKDEQVVEVARINLAPKYYYKSVPLLSPNVYRLADLVNKSELVLLPGEATMYQGTDFVGRMSMPLVAVGEQFTAGFGIDPQLQIQRQLMDKSKTTQGGNNVLKYDYRIKVNSYKTEKIALQVWDRLPAPHEAESTGVYLIKTTPELSKDPFYVREQRPNNLLRWDLEVEPGMNGEKSLKINYEFRLELDKQMLINVLQSK